MKETSSRENSLQQGPAKFCSEIHGVQETPSGSNTMQVKQKMPSVSDGLRAFDTAATPAEPSKSNSRTFKRSLHHNKTTVNNETVHIVWRRPRKKHGVRFPYSWKQNPDLMQSRLPTIPRVKAVRIKMKRNDSLREARTPLFGLCNHRRKDARRESNLEGKPPLDYLHHERRGSESGMGLVHTTSASGQRCPGRPASQMFGSQDTDGVSRERRQPHLRMSLLEEPRTQGEEASRRAQSAYRRWRMPQLETRTSWNPRCEKNYKHSD